MKTGEAVQVQRTSALAASGISILGSPAQHVIDLTHLGGKLNQASAQTGREFAFQQRHQPMPHPVAVIL